MSPQWSKKSGGEVYQAVYRREGENSDTVCLVVFSFYAVYVYASVQENLQSRNVTIIIYFVT